MRSNDRTLEEKKMIVERGRVIEVTEGKALVKIERSSACEKCHTECALKSSDTQAMVVEVRDPLDVQENQYVHVSMRDGSALRASFVVYIIPLIGLVSGALLGEYVGTLLGIKNVLAILGSFSLLGLSLLVVKCYNTRFQQNIHDQPVITQALNH
jgi:sigma-E factor negative regulatory protein RseC